ncbi:hypothetical protein L3Q72_22460 [Vibrio sp. JC009]|uniref:hypothetical protein n=1 Tax=Vibrio sp. JC009 TaxID=2912314 RepID=UPI0023B04A57|nr:hypothetical protein [Vibrio sp. JC009]WED23996.1 hypothetical protein L3Q72_22460 [Vibrio sp. JC009]
MRSICSETPDTSRYPREQYSEFENDAGQKISTASLRSSADKMIKAIGLVSSPPGDFTMKESEYNTMKSEYEAAVNKYQIS